MRWKVGVKPEVISWQLSRCANASTTAYYCYGGRLLLSPNYVSP